MKRVRRAFAIVLLVAGLVCASAAAGPGADDVRLLVSRIEALHPEPYTAISREEFHRRADVLAARADGVDRSELVVGLMRLLASLGDRNGHTAMFPGDAHTPPLHMYPLKLYDFSDGLFVIDGDSALVGARLVAVNGVPVADVVARVRPLLPGDNDWTRRMHLPEYVVTDEVLRGLRIATSGATFTLEFPSGRRDVRLQAVEGPQYARTFGFPWQLRRSALARVPLWIQKASQAQAVTVLQRGRVVYVTYNTVSSSTALAERIMKLARKKAFRRLVIDIRLNGGGNNTKYGPLLDVLRSRVVNRYTRPSVLTGRVTFSAAGNFAATVDRVTPARLVGEPTGGAPNQWGDATAEQLPNLGLRYYVASRYVEVTTPDDKRVTVEPDVRVELTSADWFAGRDPVLAAARR